ncbi:hypothetical protein FGB62_5g256 [Gracilaria domingensis]|nr:hypothetical protein FGB62_5g256 [Gracilaria domingensis]
MTYAHSHNLKGKIRDRYKKTFRNKIELGTRVEAVKKGNRLGNYFACDVINVREAPLSNEVGLYAEKNIAAKLIYTGGGVFDRKKYTYDLRYDDGSVDENVSPELIRPIVPKAH